MTKPRRKPGPKGPVRPQVAVRLGESSRGYIDNVAGYQDVTRSEMIRTMLRYAEYYMPWDWEP